MDKIICDINISVDVIIQILRLENLKDNSYICMNKNKLSKNDTIINAILILINII
jgi:hypothetical protein